MCGYRRVRRRGYVCVPIPRKTHGARFGGIVCDPSRNLLEDFLKYVYVSSLRTSVGAVHRCQIERLGLRGSLPAGPDRSIACYQRAAGAKVSEARTVSSRDQEAGSPAMPDAGM
jgi:hypothetical protein